MINIWRVAPYKKLYEEQANSRNTWNLTCQEHIIALYKCGESRVNWTLISLSNKVRPLSLISMFRHGINLQLSMPEYYITDFEL